MLSNGTNNSNQQVDPSALGRLLRLYLRGRLRGSTRLTYFLAKHFRTLQQVPLEIRGWSPVYVDLRMPSGHLMLMSSPYDGLWRELDEVNVMRRFVNAGDVVFDIGANIGLHSILLSRLVGSSGRVCAFEPNSELFPALSCTIAQLGNATLYPFALSNTTHESLLFVPPDDSVASLVDWTVNAPSFADDGPAHAVTCIERPLDSLVSENMLPEAHFIKCDVEGAELKVFEGARQTLDRSDAPLILFEVNERAMQAFNLSVSATMNFLAALPKPKYRFFAVGAEGTLTRLQEIKTDFVNVLAVPESKLGNWAELSDVQS
jgi:FkbM family methyltransferase